MSFEYNKLTRHLNSLVAFILHTNLPAQRKQWKFLLWFKCFIIVTAVQKQCLCSKTTFLSAMVVKRHLDELNLHETKVMILK